MPSVQDKKPPGLRARKLLETRRALEGATIDLALEHGLSNVTVEQIAARADVAPRTFFNHFPSKEAALLGEAAAPLDAVAGFSTEPDGTTTYEALRRFVIEAVAERVSEDGLVQRRMRALAAHPEVAQRQMTLATEMMERLATRVAARLAATAQRDPMHPTDADLVEARMLVQVCTAAIGCTFERWRREGTVGRADRALADAFDQLEAVAARHLAVPRRGGHATAERVDHA
jgi:AcrR family transcriptional regulator